MGFPAIHPSVRLPRSAWPRHPIAMTAYLWLARVLGVVGSGYALALMADPGTPRLHARLSLPGAVLLDSALLVLFALHFHFVQRPGAGHRWFRPHLRQLEGATNLLVAGSLLALVFLAWQPLASVAWAVANPDLVAACWAGWVTGWMLVLLAAHGLQPMGSVVATGVGRLAFALRGALVPGLLLVEWCVPTLTLGHLLFAGGFSVLVIRYAADLRQLAGGALQPQLISKRQAGAPVAMHSVSVTVARRCTRRANSRSKVAA